MSNEHAVTAPTFVSIPNAVLDDIDLTYQDKGLYGYILGKLDADPEWEISSKRIAEDTSEGYASIRKSINRLIEYGYIRRYRGPRNKHRVEILDKNN